MNPPNIDTVQQILKITSLIPEEISLLSNIQIYHTMTNTTDKCSGVPRNSVWVGGGFNKFSWGQRTERTGIWGW